MSQPWLFPDLAPKPPPKESFDPNKDRHNREFAELQEQWAATRDSKVLGKMFAVMRSIERNYITKYCRAHGFAFGADELEDRVEDSALFMLEKFQRDDFYIDRLSAYARWGMLKSLFGKADSDDVFESKNVKRVSYESFMDSLEK